MSRMSRAKTGAVTRRGWSRPLSSSRYDAALRGIRLDEDVEISRQTDGMHRARAQSQHHGRTGRGRDRSVTDYLWSQPMDEAQRIAQRACVVLIALFVVAVFAFIYG